MNALTNKSSFHLHMVRYNSQISTNQPVSIKFKYTSFFIYFNYLTENSKNILSVQSHDYRDMNHYMQHQFSAVNRDQLIGYLQL
ncbi:hypothetical protein SAMN05443252_101494 [Bacillus sp. OV322]|nr:hypothetical protein SAMN05443252_101494 [Bacillus sp. OV322]